jgi:hypothetical protein
MTRNVLLGLVAIASVAAATNTASAQSTPAPQHVDIPMVPGCFMCMTCGEYWTHIAAGQAPHGELGYIFNHGCVYGTRCNVHRQCLGLGPYGLTPRDSVKELLAWVADAEGDELKTVLQEYDGALVFNAERGAIQLLACDGKSVIAHVPIGEQQRAALKEEN